MPRYSEMVKEKDYEITKLKKELETTKESLKIAVDTLHYYASICNWETDDKTGTTEDYAKAHYDRLISRHNGWLEAVRTLDILGELK